MKTPIVGVLATLAGCLLAPGRPGSDGGGGDGSGSSCVSGDDVAGPAVAIQLGSDAEDTVFRAGMHAGSAVLWRFDPPVFGTGCPSDTTVIDSADPVLALTALVNATGTHVLALTATGSDATLHDLRGNGAGHYTDFYDMPIVQGAPTAIPTSAETEGVTDTPAFVTFVPKNAANEGQVWFGGGSAIWVAQMSTSLVHDTGRPAFGNASGGDRWYGAAALGSGSGVALAGEDTQAISDGSDGFAHTELAGYGDCGSGVCRGRLAFATRDVAYVLVTIARAYASHGSDDEVDLVTADGMPHQVSLVSFIADGPQRRLISDAALEELGSPAEPVLLTLWADPKATPEGSLLYAYSRLDATQFRSVSAPLVLDDEPRMTRVLLVHTAGAPRILALSARLGVDRCTRSVPVGGIVTFMDCTP